jgi:hypothetical protein
MSTVSPRTDTSQPRTRCPFCLQLSDVADGICSTCQRRIRLAGSARSHGMVLIPAATLFHRSTPLTLRVLALMQDAGAIANWIRPDVYQLARGSGATQGAVHAALKRLVANGWLERRKISTRTSNSPSDYRVPLPHGLD